MNLFHLYKADFWVKLNSTLQNRLVRRGMSKPHKDYLGHIFARCETFGLGVWRTNTSGSTIPLTPSTNVLKLESLRKIVRG
jgi:hypothetical protein